MMRRNGVLAVAVAAAIGFTACSGTDSGTTGGAAPGTSTKTTKADKADKDSKESGGGKKPGTKEPKDTSGGTPLPNDVMFNNFLVRNSAATDKADKFPKAYRALSLAVKSPPEGINTAGLETFDVSGSGQFSVGELDNIVNEAKTKSGATSVMDLDLRAESHGFISGNAISWFSPRDWSMTGLSSQQILDAEKDRLGSLEPGSTVSVIDGKEKVEGSYVTGATTDIAVDDPKDEAGLTATKGVAYQRITALDHVPMAPAELDQVVAVYQQWKAKPGTRLHVHCAGGDGRTTTVLAALDMLANASTVSIEDIVERQAALGEGTDLFGTGKPGSAFYYQYKGRERQIRRFYQYAKEHPGGEGMTFSQWDAANPG